MTAEDMVRNNQDIILFDGVCKLCSGWVSFVYRRDPEARFRFVAVQSVQGRALLQWAGLSPDVIDTMVYIENGHPHLRSTAFLKAIRHFPSAWPLLSTGLVVPVVLRDFLYDRIALNRYRLFGRRESCLLPDADLALRFL